MIEIAPSILSADFGRLGEHVAEALAAGVRRIHVDVMDGRFVPNISVGPLVVEALKPLAQQYDAVLDVHLMIVEPERFLGEFARAGAGALTVHVEGSLHLHRTISVIRRHRLQAGVSLNPATPLSALEEVLPLVDSALVMTVDPGFGGQGFIAGSLDKIGRLRGILDQRGLGHVALCVDGGINRETIGAVVRAGATIAVAGSAVFGTSSGRSVAENIRMLRAAAAAAGA